MSSASSSQAENKHRELLMSLLFAVFPFLLWLNKLSVRTLRFDLFAGITSAIFALPQGLAFAMIAGLPPEFGLYAAMVAPIVTALFGSSWHTVSGPTVATSIVVFGILMRSQAQTGGVPETPMFISMVLVLTLLAGAIQLVLGLCRLGHIVDFISHTVILGFSTGAALLIMSSQLKGIMGINFSRQENIALTLREVYRHIGETNLSILFLSLSTLMVALVFKTFFKKLPYLLIAMIYGGVAVTLMSIVLKEPNVKMVGALPQGLPTFMIPDLTWYQVREWFAAAIALATLGLIQAVSIAKTIAIKSGQSIDANQEFVAQGLANIACSFTSGFFSSSSFTRTGVNYSAGAVTPLSSIMASGLILLVLLFATDVTAFLPTATMSAIIMLIGYQLIDWGHIKNVFTTSRAESAVFVVTLLSTLFLSLEFAIYSGMFLSLLMYLQKTSTPMVLHMTVDKLDPYHRLIPLRSQQSEHPYLEIVRVDGSIFFGSVEHIRKSIDAKRLKYGTHVVLICGGVNLIDISGLELLLFIRQILRKRGGDLHLTSLTPEVRRYLIKSPYWLQLGGRDNVFDYQAEGIEAVSRIIEENQQKKKTGKEEQVPEQTGEATEETTVEVNETEKRITKKAVLR